MDQQSKQVEQNPTLCKNGCGFFSNQTSEGFCSVCYKEQMKKKEQSPQKNSSNDSMDPDVSCLKLNDKKEPKLEVNEDKNIVDSNPGENKDVNGKKRKNRCLKCKKKVGLMGFECRCGSLFCAIHRYSDKHECGFDYKELGAKEIKNNNPVVVASKIQKI